MPEPSLYQPVADELNQDIVHAGTAGLLGPAALIQDDIHKSPAASAAMLGPAAQLQDALGRARYTGNTTLPRDVKQASPVVLGRPMTQEQGRAALGMGGSVPVAHRQPFGVLTTQDMVRIAQELEQRAAEGNGAKATRMLAVFFGIQAGK